MTSTGCRVTWPCSMGRMRSSSVAEFLLSLFTTRERAREIEGDLLEQQQGRPPGWMGWQVLCITTALFRASCREAPLRIALLSLGITALTFATSVGLDRMLLAPDAWLPIPVLGWAAVAATAFIIGWVTGYFGRGIGLRAATWTLVAFTLFHAMKYLAIAMSSPLLALAYLSLSIAMQPLPLLAGGIMGHRRRRHP